MNAFGRLLARQPLIAPSLLRAPLLRAAPLQVACLASRVAVARQVPAVSRLLLRMQLDGSANLLQRRVRAEEPEQIEQARAFASSAQRPAPQNTKSSARYFLFLVAGLVAAGLAYYSFGASRLPAQPVEPELSPELAMAAEEVTKRLRLKETVSPINAGSVVSKYEMNYIPSNDPFEDHHDEKRSIRGNRFWFGVYDGHGGWECALLVQEYLTSYVAYEVEAAVGPDELPLDHKLTPDEHHKRRDLVDKAIVRAFDRLDADLLNGSLILPGAENAALRDQMRSSFAGSCALLAFIDGRDLYVACTGDARAVLGRKQKWGYETVALSQDQTTRNPEEYRRLVQEHPGEEFSVIIRGRVLGGLMPTRAFGDSRYKYPLEVMGKLLGTATARNMPRNYLTPPYVTASPVIVHHELDSRDAFMILATDGLWDTLPSEDAVAMVADLIEGARPTSLAEPTIYTKMDSNAATHLIRNSLGGRDHGRVQQLLRLQPPISRRYRDDVTVNVVFFDREVLETGSKGDAQQAEGEMMVVDPRKGDPKTKKPRFQQWLKMADAERARSRL